MTPLDYLKSNTSIIGSCLVIYSRVFEKYNTNSKMRTIHENVNDNFTMGEDLILYISTIPTCYSNPF